ncbi:Major facilitator superfamily domain, general substrate transporter [Niveomyces insectorum RCEF 264]|uniref:Major facilitator superfamily domain, general substrate transporter n=1 Tax=Niveomyces insectorum RCEF 264 TaxID=1081102 RepID=A0A167UIN9_9HYPO|nr:Major facilitator superfamily domain, general substrate transporter [Niveomyces insectorum RCEF 264]
MGARSRRSKARKSDGPPIDTSDVDRAAAYANGQDYNHTNGHPNGKTNGKTNRNSIGKANGSTLRRIRTDLTTEEASESSDMNGGVELRRKGVSHESDAVTANLMARETFTLDDHVATTPKLNSHGFLELPKQDQKNFGLLVLLYFLQGIPLGLATGSVPFLLKDHMSYGEIGVFTLASYPYSLKLFWSPIVDALWSPKIGRRKSWILPIQFLSGVGMLYLGSTVENLMETIGKPGGPTVWDFTYWWFFLVLMCATQDIAVDGWALTLLSPGNISYASTAQTIGLTAGHFLSYTVFLAFNSKDFANRWFRAAPLETGLLSLGGYLTFWGWAFILVTIGLAVAKREERAHDEEGVWDVYRIMWGVLKLKNVQAIILVHLIAKIGFQANDGVTNLKLLEKNFGTDNLALTVLIDFPFEIGLGYYVGKWSQEYTPMRIWCWGFAGRLVAAIFAQITVIIFPASGVTSWYLLVVILEHVLSTFMNTVMFVAVSAFHARIADPAIGGTYMTLLATVSNLGGTFPRYFVLRLVDAFTKATCLPGTPDPSVVLKGPLVTEAFSCAIQEDRNRCRAGGGICEVERDGYYIVNILCVLVGTVAFFSFVRPQVLRLQALPLKAWRLSNAQMRPS